MKEFEKGTFATPAMKIVQNAKEHYLHYFS